jgi:hypothetical protein
MGQTAARVPAGAPYRFKAVLAMLSIRCRSRCGITLVEMLVALAVTLLMMGAVITVFGFIGERVTDSRAIIETTDRMRSAAHRLREDLASLTVDPIPWQRPESNAGYLEILEGPLRDYGVDNTGNFDPFTLRGDSDDLLAFTARSAGDSFRGKFGDSSIESNTAEVIWYMRPMIGITTNPPTYSLCRRQLLIVPSTAAFPATTDQTFFNAYDVSARLDQAPNGSGIGRIANTLGDLTKRENRFLHNRQYVNSLSAQNRGYPWPVRYQVDNPPVPPLPDIRLGEDVVLTNVLSFDVQVFDPTVEIRANQRGALAPGDPGYRNRPPNPASPARGAYIDLGDTTVGAQFFGVMPAEVAARSLLSPTGQFLYSTYDTTFGPDKGTNGLDDNANASPGVDDVSERETSPPYPTPLRGLRVRIRVYEPGTKQVRETTIVQSFVPE